MAHQTGLVALRSTWWCRRRTARRATWHEVIDGDVGCILLGKAVGDPKQVSQGDIASAFRAARLALHGDEGLWRQLGATAIALDVIEVGHAVSIPSLLDHGGHHKRHSRGYLRALTPTLLASGLQKGLFTGNPEFV